MKGLKDLPMQMTRTYLWLLGVTQNDMEIEISELLLRTSEQIATEYKKKTIIE
jgi:hypothetical protein